MFVMNHNTLCVVVGKMSYIKSDFVIRGFVLFLGVGKGKKTKDIYTLGIPNSFDHWCVTHILLSKCVVIGSIDGIN